MTEAQSREHELRKAYWAAYRALEHPSDSDLILAYGMGLGDDLQGRRESDPMLTLAYGERGKE